MAEVVALTLANICLDVQIGICIFLHPSDILALRKTCTALQPSTRQRVVWVAALHRVCFDNALFLPSFPISDMSDLELEKAAMGPRRWIERCGAFEKQHLNDPGAMLRPRSARNIQDSFATKVNYRTEIFIVPGGRYLVGYSPDNISILDLGYSSSADCKLIASVQHGLKFCLVQATLDGMGLIIFSSNERDCSVYEIYPQSETPHLTLVAHLVLDNCPGIRAPYLLPETVILWHFYENKIVFRVWDYRLNHFTSFSPDSDIIKFSFQVMGTKTAVILLCQKAIFIWAIPPLSPQPPDFFDNHTHMPPLFTLPFPDNIVRFPHLVDWKTISSWYIGSSHPLYFDMLCQDSKLHRFQIMLKPDLSSASLHVICASELTAHDFNHTFFDDYRVCEDTLVSCWMSKHRDDQYQSGVYTGLTSARFANVISQHSPAAKMSLPDSGDHYYLSLCPASGRLVYLDINDNVAVIDIF